MKKRIHFTTTINAPRARVWDAMLDQDTYRQWTSEFTEGSHYEGSWDAGQRIRFLGPDGSGMVAEIAENRPHEFISIKHLGELKNGVEDTTSEAVRKWAPAYENYTLTDNGAGTDVRVDMDVMPEYEDFMQKTWPKALARLKAISERG